MTGPGIFSYSTTPANNVQANTGINWDEGMSPAAVNNSARQNMTDTRNAFNDLMWFKYGKGDGDYSPVYVSGTSFKVAGIDVTATYQVGRRVRAVGSLTGTIYGTITATTFSTDTTCTVAWDSGSLSNEALTISLSQIPVTGNPLGKLNVQNYVNGAAQIICSNIGGGNAAYAEIAANTGNELLLRQFGTGFTTTGINRQDGSLIQANGAGGLTLGTGAAQPIYIITNGAQIAEFSGSSFLLNATSTLNSAKMTVAIAGSQGIAMNDTSATNGTQFMEFYSNGGGLGTITNNNNAGVSFNTTSDRRLKKNIDDAADPGPIIDALRVRQWNWRINDSFEGWGFIAQEEVEVAPFAVVVGDNGEDPDNIEVRWGRDDSKLVPLLVKEIQLLRARVASLEAK